MEFTKDINFDTNLEAGKETKITYSGTLFQNGSNYVNIVYGFGEAWNNTTTKLMEKTENGFVANVRMRNFDTFNFCFSNENNIWDNNNSFNYISPIIPEVQETENVDNIDFGTDYSTSIDNIIEEILGNTTKQDIISDKDNCSIDKILESINEESLPEIESLFNDLFFEAYKEDTTPTVSEISMDPSLAEELREVGETFDNMVSTPVTKKVNNSLLAEELGSAFDNFQNMIFTNPVSEEPIKESADNAEIIKLFNELFDMSSQPITFEVQEETSTPVEMPSAEKVETSDLNLSNSEFNELVSDLLDQLANFETSTPQETETPELNTAAFNLDGLVSDLLEPVITSETYAQKAVEETSLFEDIKAHEDDEETSLTLINSGEFLVSPRKLSYFYKLRKRIRLAFIKLLRTSKDFVKQLGL